MASSFTPLSAKILARGVQSSLTKGAHRANPSARRAERGVPASRSSQVEAVNGVCSSKEAIIRFGIEEKRFSAWGGSLFCVAFPDMVQCTLWRKKKSRRRNLFFRRFASGRRGREQENSPAPCRLNRHNAPNSSPFQFRHSVRRSRRTHFAAPLTERPTISH